MTEPADHQPAPRPELLTIGNDRVRVDIDAGRGGRVAQITFRGIDLLIGADAAGGDPMRWGCYPMVPWAGRVRGGRFDFAGASHQLPVGADGHAIHGVGYTSAWTPTGRDATRAELTLQLPQDAGWPFGGTAGQRIAVDGDQVVLELTATAGGVACPVTLGWHPWFRKPDRLGFDPISMYRRVDGVTVDQQVGVPPGPWDDCFVNVDPVIARVAGVTVRLTSDCTDWVVYDEPAHATCIEPQSGPPDAFNIRPRVLERHRQLTRWFRIALAT